MCKTDVLNASVIVKFNADLNICPSLGQVTVFGYTIAS